jgi:hypothetical protein
MVTRFESFDARTGPMRSPQDVAPRMQRRARAALDLDSG